MSARRIVSLGRRLSELADEIPDRLAIIMKYRGSADETVTYRELDRRSNRAARLLAERGVAETSRVALALRNSVAHFVATYAIWKLGACVFSIRSDVPAWERERLFSVANPSHVIGDFSDVDRPQITSAELADLDRFSDEPLPDIVPNPFKFNPTGGSTGLQKVVVPTEPGVVGVGDPLANSSLQLPEGCVQLVTGPLYHFGPQRNAFTGLSQGETLVVLPKFDAALAMESIGKHRVNIAMIVPTMLYRVVHLPDVERYDLSSLLCASVGGSKCPEWVFEKAITIFGAERLMLTYGGTESIGVATTMGPEWLTHRGTCGRPTLTDIRIQDETGKTLPPGEVGEIWLRPKGGIKTRYLGEEMRLSPDGFATLGDLGWMDEDGFLYVADRRKDLIVSGAANIYPAEVEAVLLAHPSVSDAAVVGVPDAEWGARVHAIVVPADGQTIDFEDLRGFCRARLAAYKVPKSFATMDSLPRDGLGKLRRSALVPDT